MPSAYEYEIFGCTLLSSVPIPELPDTKGSGANGQMRLHVDRDATLKKIEQWTPLWVNDDGVPWLQVHIESPDSYSLRFPEIADFQIEIQSNERLNATLNCFPCDGVPDFTIHHIVLDQVIPLVLSYFGRVLLHMAVVKVGDAGIGFLGKSGQGKSTMTAEFSRHGHVAVSDDTVLLHCEDGNYSAISNYPGVRLWSDSHEQLLNESEFSAAAHYSSKRRVVADELDFSPEPVPLAAFYSLQLPPKESPDEIQISRLGFPEAMKTLIESKFRLETHNKPDMKKEFESVSELAATVPCFSVTYPRDYSIIGNVREALIAETLRVMKATRVDF